MARSRGDRPDTAGALWEGTEKAWALLFSAGSHPLGCIPGHVRHRGGRGVVRDDEMLLTKTDVLSFSGRTMSKLLTMDQASEYLGVSKLTLYGWVSARKLSYIKVGRLVKFKQDQLDKWIDQRTVKGGDDRFKIRTREGVHGSH